MTNQLVQNLQLHKKISTSLRVCSSTICTKFNVQIRAGRLLKGFGQASLSEARHGSMPLQLKTKQSCLQKHQLLKNTYLQDQDNKENGFTLDKNTLDRNNFNNYATKKTISQGFMDVTILSANASQLKVILKEPDSEYYTLLLVLISISMILQVFSAYIFIIE